MLCFLLQHVHGPTWTKIVRRRGHGAIKARQNGIPNTAGHTMCPKAHNNEDQRLIHTTTLTRKANNAVGRQTKDSPGSVGNGNVFHGYGKPPELNGTKYPCVVLSAVCRR